MRKMYPEMNYIDEYLYEVKRDEIEKVSDMKEWLEYNHHIFFLYRNDLFQLWHFKEKGVFCWQINIHSKENGDFVEEIKTWHSFTDAISDPVFSDKSFSDIFDFVTLFY